MSLPDCLSCRLISRLPFRILARDLEIWFIGSSRSLDIGDGSIRYLAYELLFVFHFMAVSFTVFEIK